MKAKVKKKSWVGWVSDNFDWELITKGVLPTMTTEYDRFWQYRTKVKITIQEIPNRRKLEPK